MKVIRTAIPDVLILRPDVFGDERGYFMESYNSRTFRELTGLDVLFVQDNESRSSYGVLRGLHFQLGDHVQSKLIRVVEGKVLDVAVDVRRGSPWFGSHVAIELSAESHDQVFIPKGFAHGFCVLSESALFQYKCDAFYAPGHEGGIAWDDPDIGIDWRIPASDVKLSAKDMLNGRLCECEPSKLFEYGI